MVEKIEEKIDKKLRKGPAGLTFMILLFIIVFLVGISAGSISGYFYGKKKSVQNNENNQTNDNTEDKEDESTGTENTTAESDEQTYTVQKGDTLFTIGLKFNIPWTKIAEANGLSESSVIKEGQILKIPGAATSPTGESKKFTIDTAAMQQVQSQVDSGQITWYLDPVAVSKNQVPPTYSISKDDNYTLKSKSTAEGIAIVEVVHDTKVYQIKLIQPVIKGIDGIWAVDIVSRI